MFSRYMHVRECGNLKKKIIITSTPGCPSQEVE
jgi:hypothetical protein